MKKSQIKTRFSIWSIKIAIGMNNLAFTMTTKPKVLCQKSEWMTPFEEQIN